MISHDIEAAVGFASHILHIGKRIFFGTKEEYVSSDIGKYFLLQEQEGHEREEAK
jgi:zinc transport system ATP-binding protein